MAKPIKPNEIIAIKKEQFPEEVFEVVNEIIAKYWDGYSSSFLQKELAKAIASKLKCTTAEVYKNHYLDIEEMYEEAGWNVVYDKPGYNESYEASFTFTKSKKGD